MLIAIFANVWVLGTVCTDDFGRWLTKRGIKRLIESSKKRNDEFNFDIKSKYWVSNSCYQRYTKSRKLIDSKTEEFGIQPKRARLNGEPPYDYKTHCLICEEMLDFKAAEKYKSNNKYKPTRKTFMRYPRSEKYS